MEKVAANKVSSHCFFLYGSGYDMIVLFVYINKAFLCDFPSNWFISEQNNFLLLSCMFVYV
jgi:hypothetical protein